MAANGKKDTLAVIGDGNKLAQAASLLMENVQAMSAPGDMGMGLLPTIKLKHAGTVGFGIDDGVSGEDIITGKDGFDAIILYSQPVRVYWAKGFDEKSDDDNPAPDCSSLDCIIGRGEAWGSKKGEIGVQQCADCPHAQWDSAKKGRGQACRVRTRQFILPAGSLIPHMFEVPTTSTRTAAQYGVGLANKGLQYFAAVTHFGAIGAKNRDGVDYSVLELELVGGLDEAAVEQLDVMRQTCASIASQLPVGMEE